MNGTTHLRHRWMSLLGAVLIAGMVLSLMFGALNQRAHAQATSTLTGTVIATSTMSTSTASSTLTGMLIGIVLGTTTATTSEFDRLLAELRGMQTTYPSFVSLIQSWIDQLLGIGTTTGTTTPGMVNPTGAYIDQNDMTKMAGDQIDFGGHNFGHEENINVMLGGIRIAVAHADGGGNFSTGSLRLPSTPGTYTYLFQSQTSSTSLPVTITVR